MGDASENKVVAETDIAKFVYEKKFTCPVCDMVFPSPVARYGKSRQVSQDSDLKQNYEPFDPVAYDVVVCPNCGYAEAVGSFEKNLHDRVKAQLIEMVKPNFRGKIYPLELTTEMALERYYIMTVCNEVKGGTKGMLAYANLKMAWVCRNAKDIREGGYLKQALENFKEAIQKETPPIAGMDETVVSYLIGELERRNGNDEEALRWFSRLVTSSTNPRIKDRARDQRDLIMLARKQGQEGGEAPEQENKAAPAKKEPEKKKKRFGWF